MGGEKVTLTTDDQKRLERAAMASTEKLYDLDAAPAEMPGLEDVALAIKRAQLGDRAELSKDGPWREHELKPAQRVLALFAPILAEKERRIVNLSQGLEDAVQTSVKVGMTWQAAAEKAEARALAAEAALAGERANAVDGSIDIRLDDKGGIDEIFGNGVLCHIERMDKGHWFISMIRPDQTSEAFWLNGNGKVEFTMHEHRPAPTTGPNVEPWTIAAAIRAGE